MLKLPIIEPYEDYKSKLSQMKYQGAGLIGITAAAGNNGILHKDFN